MINADTRSTGFHRALPSLCASLTAIAIFAITLGGGFAYDFYGIARSDPRLLHPETWGSYWKQAYLSGIDNLYRPLTSTVMAAESWAFGLDESHAWRFHVVSILLHAGVSALVAELARRLVNWRAAIVAGLLFAAHPIHVEAITDVVGQAELLCALGTLGALVLFLHPPMTIARAICIFGCFLAALLSKEQGMLLPGLLLILAVSLKLRPRDRHEVVRVDSQHDVLSYSDLSTTRADVAKKQAMQWLIVLLCFGLGGYVFIRENVLHLRFWWNRGFLDPEINPMRLCAGSDRILMPLILLGRYTHLLIFPWKLAPDYSGQAIGSEARLDDPYLWAGAGALFVWIVLFVVALRRRAGVMLFCLMGVGITYGLVGNAVVIIGTNFAERLMYLPSVFFIILIAMALAQLRVTILVDAMIVLLVLASLRSFTYARRWNNRLVLYEQALRDQPKAIRMYVYLAAEYNERGERQRAIALMKDARELRPAYGYLWVISAELAIQNNDLDIAEQYLRHAEVLELSFRTIALEKELEDKRAATQSSQ